LQGNTTTITQEEWYRYRLERHISYAVWQEGEYHDEVIDHYLCLQLNHHKPVLLRTIGRGQLIYTMPIQAQPFQGEVPDNFHSSLVELLIYPFDLRIE
jgi:hypothetical protein